MERQAKLTHSDFKPRCDECAGLCCVIPEISAADGIRLKTMNRVCQHLDIDARGIGHACAIYASRKYEGYLVCKAYSCGGAGQAVTTHARANGGILMNGTVTRDTLELFDFFTRIAWFLEANADIPDEAGFFGSKARSAFIRDCRNIYRRFLETSEVAYPDGNPADLRALRKWYADEYQAKFATMFGIPIFRKPKERPNEPIGHSGDNHDVPQY